MMNALVIVAALVGVLLVFVVVVVVRIVLGVFLDDHNTLWSDRRLWLLPDARRQKKALFDAVTRRFHFLEALAFTPRDMGDYHRYESDQVVVIVAWERLHGGEVHVHIGLRSPPGEREVVFPMGALLGMEGVPRPRATFVRNERDLDEVIERMADDVRRYGKSALNGDREYFSRLNSVALEALQAPPEIGAVRS